MSDDFGGICAVLPVNTAELFDRNVALLARLTPLLAVEKLGLC